MARLAFWIVVLLIVVPPTLGTFFVPNRHNAITDWSMFSKPTNTALCAGSFDVSTDGEHWSAWDGRITVNGHKHLYRTPILFTARDVEAQLGVMCGSSQNVSFRPRISCLEDMKTWKSLNYDVVDCKNRTSPSL